MQSEARVRRNWQSSDGVVAVAVEPTFDFMSAAYAEVFDGSEATAFQHPVWLDAAFRYLAPARMAEPVVVTGRGADGRLQFVLPLIRRRLNGIELLEAADFGVSDYCSPVTLTDFVPPRDLLDMVARILPSHDILRLKPSRPEAARAWQAFFSVRQVELDFSAHATELAASYDEWRGRAYQPAFAKYLDRRLRKFWKGEGVALRHLTDPDEIRCAIGTIRALRSGRFGGDPIQDPAVYAFYAEVAAVGAAHGLTRTYALDLGGETLGLVFGLTHGGRFHYLLIGCDYERHGRHSPGLILYDAMIRDWIDEGGTAFDFTIGDEPFKLDFGTQATPMVEMISTPTWRGKLARAAFDARDQLRRLRARGQK